MKVGKPGIKKLKDDWVWRPLKMGPEQSDGGHQTGMLLEYESYPCGFCNGTGQKPKGSRCPVCRGAGTVSVDPPAVKCAYCKGKGEDKPRGNVTCTACRGKGVIHVEEPIEMCSHCRGTGKEPTNKLICGKCRGKGVITVREERSEPEDEFEKFNSFAEEVIETKVKEERVGSASGSERDALQIIKGLGQADRAAVARNMSPSISSAYAKQLCDALVKKKLLLRHGLMYNLSPHGERIME